MTGENFGLALGKYINHAPKDNPNCNCVGVIVEMHVRGRVERGPKVLFKTTRAVQKGEELLYDYGFRDPNLPWTYTG